MSLKSNLLVLAVLVFASPSLRADIARTSTVRFKLQFENLADYPDHDFYVMYCLIHGDRPSAHLTRVTPDTVVSLKGVWGGEVSLIAVPHGHPEPSLKDDGRLTTEEPGTLEVRLKIDDDDAGYQFSYRVAIEDNRMSAVQTGQQLSPLDWFRSNFFFVVGGAALSLCCALIVLWLVRRQRSKVTPHHAADPAQ
jgi:hypothetical protein